MNFISNNLCDSKWHDRLYPKKDRGSLVFNYYSQKEILHIKKYMNRDSI